MKLYSSFFLLMFLTNITCNAVLTEIDYLSLNNKNLVLLSEVHVIEGVPAMQIIERDDEQLKSMSELVCKHDQKGLTGSILIEVPCMTKPHTVTAYLLDELAACGNITAKNIEFRCVANAATYIFATPSPDSIGSGLTSKSFDRERIVSLLTFKDLHEEYEAYRLIVIQWLEMLKEQKKYLVPLFEKMEKEYQDFNKALEVQGITNNELILDISQEMVAQHKVRQRISLRGWISYIYSRLLDLYILKRICSSPHENLTVIAGQDHIDTIRSILIDMRAKFFKSRDRKDGLKAHELGLAGVQNSLCDYNPIYCSIL